MVIKNKDLAGFHSHYCKEYQQSILDEEAYHIIYRERCFILGSLDMMKLRRSKIINLEELCSEAFKPSRLENRLISFGEDYEFC
jgi:hypothetical protein